MKVPCWGMEASFRTFFLNKFLNLFGAQLNYRSYRFQLDREKYTKEITHFFHYVSLNVRFG